MESDWKELEGGGRKRAYCKPGNTDLYFMFVFAE